MAATTGILDLPVELLHQIFSYLDVPGFLNLTSTCEALHKPWFIHDSAYWSTLVRTTFRVPNQPVVEKDGERWQSLYRKMLTQSKIYTWGNNEKACLGHSFELPSVLQGNGARRVRHNSALRRRHISWPEPMEHVEDVGIVSDLQCGGWSTTLLTAKGALYTVGVIDGRHQWLAGRQIYMQRVHTEAVGLRYPPGFPPPNDRYDPSTAVKQFSSGRAHILALTDSGRIWSWQDIEKAALNVRFLHHDTAETGSKSGRGVVSKVVAGWSKSAALIEGTGIALWEPLQRDHDDNELEDAALVLESVVVPQTSFRTADIKLGGRLRPEDAILADTVGEVLNFVVLEDVVLFQTHLGKVFAAQILWDEPDRRVSNPLEIQLSASEDEEMFATDVQGSFHSFAVFTRSGAVLTSKQGRVVDLIQHQLGDQPLFTRIPALQNKRVIQLAFGDYHFHALHAPGYITSYGSEPQTCGALGLGGHGDGEGRLRGIRYQGVGGDGRLVPHAYTEGRRVWFEREKRVWIQFLTSGGVDPAEAMERERMAIGSPGVTCQGEVSEWIEQEGRDWETKYGVRDADDDGLGAYFATSVTAAGWHSGALVLVNGRLAERLKRACETPDPPAVPHPSPDATMPSDSPGEGTDQSAGTLAGLVNWTITTGLDYGRWFLGLPPYNAPTVTQEERPGATAQLENFQRGTHPLNYGASPRVGVRYIWADDHFPRLKLSDGTEMPGNVPFDDWRYSRPEWDLAFTL